MVDDVGEVAFDHAESFHAPVATGLSSCEEIFGGLVNADLGEGYSVERGVELAVSDTD